MVRRRQHLCRQLGQDGDVATPVWVLMVSMGQRLCLWVRTSVCLWEWECVCECVYARRTRVIKCV